MQTTAARNYFTLSSAATAHGRIPSDAKEDGSFPHAEIGTVGDASSFWPA